MGTTMTLLELHDAIAKAIADAIGHGMREKCARHADAVLAVVGPQLVAAAEHVERIKADEGAVTEAVLDRACFAAINRDRQTMVRHVRAAYDEQLAFREDVRAALLAVWPNPPAQAAQVETWRQMDSAPRDGTMLRLLVQFEDHATEDTTDPAPTIGAYEEGAECWQFAGWCWTHDHFTEGKGAPVGWLPMLATAEPVAQGEVDELFNTFRLAYYGSNKSLAPELESFRRAYRAIAAQPRAVPDGWRAKVDEIANNIGESLNFGCDQDAVYRINVYVDELFALAAAPSPGESNG